MNKTTQDLIVNLCSVAKITTANTVSTIELFDELKQLTPDELETLKFKTRKLLRLIGNAQKTVKYKKV